MLPERRTEDLEIVELPDEALVYDLRRHRAFCLNRTAAAVWRRCDGRTAVPELAEALATELGGPAGEDLVCVALRQLERARLLREKVTHRMAGSPSRRLFLKKAAMIGVGAVLLPSVASLAAPSVAQAVTCINVSCAGGGQNCPGGTADIGKPCGPEGGCVCTCRLSGQQVKCKN